MANPKVAHSVITHKRHIEVYTDDLESSVIEIGGIGGVVVVLLLASISMISVSVDPRYDIEEIAQEIRDLLAAEVPDIFRE